MSLYNLRRLAPDTYMIAKFTDDFEVESTYTLTAKGFSYTCDCPANSRSVVTKPCRHKLMMPTLLTAVDTDRFYDHDTGRFSTPLGDLFRPTADLEAQEALPVVGEAPGSPIQQTETQTFHYLTDEPPIKYTLHRVVDAPPAPAAQSSAPTIRRR